MNTRNCISSFFVLALGLALGTPARAEPTDITIRVISRDAKFIGTSMGGVQITLRDASTGELLGEGETAGGTGDTDRLMKHSQTRRDLLATDESAKFTTTLDISAPRLIEVAAKGPSVKASSANRVSATQWILPGKHLTGGDGWILEMPGFFVDAQGPETAVDLNGTPRMVDITADVKMMCGCPIEPGGLWDANKYEIKAQLTRNGEIAGQAEMKYAGNPSQFTVSFNIDKPGNYETLVYAYDSQNGNTGLDVVSFVALP